MSDAKLNKVLVADVLVKIPTKVAKRSVGGSTYHEVPAGGSMAVSQQHGNT
jgi:hypothetical protein